MADLLDAERRMLSSNRCFLCEHNVCSYFNDMLISWLNWSSISNWNVTLFVVFYTGNLQVYMECLMHYLYTVSTSYFCLHVLIVQVSFAYLLHVCTIELRKMRIRDPVCIYCICCVCTHFLM